MHQTCIVPDPTWQDNSTQHHYFHVWVQNLNPKRLASTPPGEGRISCMAPVWRSRCLPDGVLALEDMHCPSKAEAFLQPQILHLRGCSQIPATHQSAQTLYWPHQQYCCGHCLSAHGVCCSCAIASSFCSLSKPSALEPSWHGRPLPCHSLHRKA